MDKGTQVHVITVLLLGCLFLSCQIAIADPYNYYNQYKGTEDERREGTSYYYTEQLERAREGRQRAGTDYYYPDQIDKDQSDRARTGTSFYYPESDGEFKEDVEEVDIKQYYKDLNQDGVTDIFTMCAGSVCYEYNQVGELLGVRDASEVLQEEDKELEIKK